MNVLSLTAILKGKNGFVEMYAFACLNGILIYIVPSTFTDNYAGFEMKLRLKNVCGICSTPIKNMPRETSSFF